MSDRRDSRDSHYSRLFACRLNATVAKVQKGRTDGENFIRRRKNISHRSSPRLSRRVTRMPYCPPWPSGLLSIMLFSILPAAEIERHAEGCSGGQTRVQTMAFFGKERVCQIVDIIFSSPNWAATQRWPYKGCTKSAPRYTVVEYYIRGRIYGIPSRDIIVLAPMTRDYY